MGYGSDSKTVFCIVLGFCERFQRVLQVLLQIPTNRIFFVNNMLLLSPTNLLV